MVGERRVDMAGSRGDLPDRRHVRGQVAIELGVAELWEGLYLEALVAVADVDGQQGADVREIAGDASLPGRLAAARDDLELSPAPVADSVDPRERCRVTILAEKVDFMPEPRERLGDVGVVDVAARAAQQVAVEDQDPDGRGRYTRRCPLNCAVLNERQRYRLRAPASGREAIAAIDGDRVYLDRETGEEMRPVTRVLPLAPSASSLLRSPENLRECRRCAQLIGLDVSDCPYCGLRQPALDGTA
jgi:hypothetical protein